MTDLSLGEAEALLRKAARGAGLPWGLAAEAARAFRLALAAGHAEAPEIFAEWLAAGDQGAECPLRRGLHAAETGADSPPGHPAAKFIFAAAADRLPPARAHRAEIAPDTLTRLETLAARTYAPATEESRARGAG